MKAFFKKNLPTFVFVLTAISSQNSVAADAVAAEAADSQAKAKLASQSDSLTTALLTYSSKSTVLKSSDADVQQAAQNALTEYQSYYRTVERWCWKSVKEQTSTLAQAENKEERSTLIGTGFTMAATIATYHPVSAGLAAVGSWFTANSARVGQDVNSHTAQLQTYQQNLQSAFSQYFATISTIDKAAGDTPWSVSALTQKTTALDTLLVACDGLGLQPAQPNTQGTSDQSQNTQPLPAGAEDKSAGGAPKKS